MFTGSDAKKLLVHDGLAHSTFFLIYYIAQCIADALSVVLRLSELSWLGYCFDDAVVCHDLLDSWWEFAFAALA